MQNNTIKINNSAKIYAFIENLRLHIGAVKNFNHYVKNWLKANTTEHFEAIDDTIAPSKILTTVMAAKEFTVRHMSNLKNLLNVLNSLTGGEHNSLSDNLSNQELQNHKKALTVTNQLNTLTMALDDLLKAVGTA